MQVSAVTENGYTWHHISSYFQVCFAILQTPCCICKCSFWPYPVTIIYLLYSSILRSFCQKSRHYLDMPRYCCKNENLDEGNFLIFKWTNFHFIYPLAYWEALTPFIDMVGWSTSSIRHRNELPKVLLKPYRRTKLHMSSSSRCIFFSSINILREMRDTRIL